MPTPPALSFIPLLCTQERRAGMMGLWVLVSCALILAFVGGNGAEGSGLVMNYYQDSCPQAEDIIQEQVGLLYKKHKNTAFSWLRNIFHDCFVESCDASLLLDSTKKSVSEKETDRSFGLRNFKYLDTIKEALERECPGVVSCSDILVLSARDGIVALGGPYIPLKTGRRDGRKSRANVVESYLPDHNESISTVLSRFEAVGIDTPGVVALLGAHSVGRTHCVKLVHRLYPDVDSSLDPAHAEYMKWKCPDAIPNPKAVQYVRNDRGTPMKLDNNYYRNLMENKGLLIVDQQLYADSRTRRHVKMMAKDQDYFFTHFARALTILSENNPLTGGVPLLYCCFSWCLVLESIIPFEVAAAASWLRWISMVRKPIRDLFWRSSWRPVVVKRVALLLEERVEGQVKISETDFRICFTCGCHWAS